MFYNKGKGALTAENMFYNKGKGALFNSTEKENYLGIFTTQKIYIIKGRLQDKKSI